uniref:Uncharacterized protein n=1 Tax=Panagrolaimus superbus TaxID=310955 RepID=A0A914YW83_9BILA
MSIMYSMQPFGEVHVQPADILYKLPSYHGDEASSSSNTTPCPLGTILNKSADLKEYINKIVEATSNLSISMKNFTEEQKKQSSTHTVSTGPYFQTTSNKKLSFELQEGFSRASAQFHYKLAQYESLSNYKFEVFAGPKYHDICKLLHEMSANRTKAINFRDVTTDGIYVEATSADGQKVTVKSSVPSLLLIGEAFGIYSYRDYHLSDSGEWLAIFDDALHGRISISDLIRKANCHLGPHDLFTKSNSVSLADIVFYAIARNTAMLPNNAEMFVKRIAEAISRA